MQIKPNEYIIRCHCSDPSHPLWIYLDEDDKMFYVQVEPMRMHTVFKRIKLAVAFIFNRTRPFALFDMVVDDREMANFASWITERLKVLKGELL